MVVAKHNHHGRLVATLFSLAKNAAYLHHHQSLWSQMERHLEKSLFCIYLHCLWGHWLHGAAPMCRCSGSAVRRLPKHDTRPCSCCDCSTPFSLQASCRNLPTNTVHIPHQRRPVRLCSTINTVSTAGFFFSTTTFSLAVLRIDSSQIASTYHSFSAFSSASSQSTVSSSSIARMKLSVFLTAVVGVLLGTAVGKFIRCEALCNSQLTIYPSHWQACQPRRCRQEDSCRRRCCVCARR